MHPYLRLHNVHAAVVPSHTLHNAFGDDACASRVRGAPAHARARARALYDQTGVITRKHKLTICPGVLVSLATSRVRCNNWYTLSSATPPTTNYPPPYDQSALAHHPLSPLDDVASQPSLSKFDVSAYSAMEKSIESENSMK